MRLYKYINETFGVNNIALKRIKVSELYSLNDPFEFIGFDLRNPLTRAAIESTKRVLSNTKGLISFSSTKNEPLLWGHYADSHRGMALGFDIDDSILSKVTYHPTRPAIEVDKNTGHPIDGNKVLDLMIANKSVKWRYEKEWRVFVELDEISREGGMHFCNFDEKIKLKEIWLGMNSALTRERIETLVSGYGEKIIIRKMKLHLKDYRTTEDRTFRVR